MKKYKSHKVVEAGIINSIGIPSGISIPIGIDGGETELVSAEWIRKHEPKIGGYFVRYEGGYCSYSPADVFEKGNTSLEDAGRIPESDAPDSPFSDTPGEGKVNVSHVAQICHEVNRAYCQSIGDDSQPEWKDAPQWQQASAINGVIAHLNNDLTPEQSHESWLAEKKKDGWKYGKVKDAEKKTHPCFVPYKKLPKDQKTKDYLFRAVVNSFKK